MQLYFHPMTEGIAGPIRRFLLLGATVLFLAAGPFSLQAQPDSLQTAASLAEKIYVQLDSKVYTNDKTIWFKAIVTNAIDHAPTALSRVLYVELANPNGQVVEKKLVKVEQGIADGFFQLHKNYLPGTYLVRAYTEWDRNFGDDFFFHEYIQVFSATLANFTKASPIKNITLREGQVSASLYPREIDSLHTKDLTLFLCADGNTDTLMIKGNGTSYQLDYPVPAKGQFLTMRMLTGNGAQFTKTIILQKDYLDLQFFAESGEMVHGLPALLAFKALDSSNKGTQVEGQIFDSNGMEVATFKSNVLGMGTVVLPMADSTVRYTAKVLPQAANAPARVFVLPAVAAKGNVLSVTKVADRIRIKATSNYIDNDSICVRVSCRGVVYCDAKGILKKGSLEFSLPHNILPEGIIAFTLLNDSMRAIAERLYFNERPETRLDITVAADRQRYGQRGLTKLNIGTKSQDGLPVAANVSVLVVNKAQMGQMQDMRQNILSYFLVASELEGEIENPGFYFSANTDRQQDLNALLLTQGWRKYHYAKPVDKIVFQPEAALTISGTVNGNLLQKKRKRGVELTMMTFGKPSSVYAETSDSLGRFSFVADNEYGDNINVLIQTRNNAGSQKDYTVNLDKKTSPAVIFNYNKSAEAPDSIARAYVAKMIERKNSEDDYRIRSEGATLDDVKVAGYRMTPERKLVTEKYGKPKWVIEGKAISEKEEKWSYGLYSVLLFNFPDKVRIERRGMDLYASLSNNELTLVVIDGIPVQPHDYPLVAGISPGEVISFEIIEYARNFMALYCEVYPRGCLTAPMTGNVIAIYTYGRKGLFGAHRTPGLVKASVPVFSAPREFYAPKYEKLMPDDWRKPDLRTVVYWTPAAQTDSLGRLSASFYNGDITGAIQVVVEAVSPDGEIGYREMFFEVDKRE
jgi:hypothetical protein